MLFFRDECEMTLNFSHKLKIEENELKKLKMLYKFICKIWKRQFPSDTTEFNYNKREFSYQKICDDLDYYCDRWCAERIQQVYITYTGLLKEYEKKHDCILFEEALGKLVMTKRRKD